MKTLKSNFDDEAKIKMLLEADAALNLSGVMAEAEKQRGQQLKMITVLLAAGAKL